MTKSTLSIEFIETEQLTNRQKDAVARLRLAAYPPEPLPRRLYLWALRRFRDAFYPSEYLLKLPGRRYKWAPPQWSVLITDGDELATRLGMVVREINSNGKSKRIGGFCAAMTHPAKRRKGLLRLAMQEATRRFHDELNVSFGLLFCRPPLVPLYERLMWKLFQGIVLADQPEGKVDFTSKGPMVLDILEQAPLQGTLDLNGLPW